MNHENWIDSRGSVFLVYPITELANDLHVAESTVSAALKTLERYDLIRRVRNIEHSANLIYVRIPDPADIEKAKKHAEKIPNSKKKKQRMDRVTRYKKSVENTLYGDVSCENESEPHKSDDFGNPQQAPPEFRKSHTQNSTAATSDFHTVAPTAIPTSHQQNSMSGTPQISHARKNNKERRIEKEQNRYPNRTPYGKFQNVLLSQDEYERLAGMYPYLDQMIDEMSTYLSANGKHYHNYEAALLTWAASHPNSIYSHSYGPKKGKT